MQRRHFLGAAVLAAAAGFLPGLATAQNLDPDVLRVALLPDESPATIIQNNQALKDYLTERTGKEIELIVTTDYSSMIEAMRFDRIELAYFGPFSYVLAKERAPGIEPFAALIAGGAPTYTSVVIANADSGIEEIADLSGRTVGYGDPASTSSHLIPRAYIQEEAGLVAGSDYEFHHLGTHDAVARAVESGKVEAGGLSSAIFASLLERGKLDPSKVRVIAESAPIPNYPWTLQGWLAPELKEKIRNAFLNLKDEAVLGPFKGEGFAAMTDADYEILRRVARTLEMDLNKGS